MDASRDYYAILGVLPSIDQEALSAVYRALIKKYHPDVFQGEKSESERIARQLNEAYSVLGNPKARAEYDRLRNKDSTSAGDYEAQSSYADNENASPEDPLHKDWSYIRTYYPSAEDQRKELQKISASLALKFQLQLLEAKTAAHAHDVAIALKDQFLERYFGSSSKIQNFALEAILSGKRSVASEVNRALKILGNPSPEAEDAFLLRVEKTCGWQSATRLGYGFSSPLYVSKKSPFKRIAKIVFACAAIYVASRVALGLLRWFST